MLVRAVHPGTKNVGFACVAHEPVVSGFSLSGSSSWLPIHIRKQQVACKMHKRSS